MDIADFKSVSHHRWDRIPEEPLKGTITRRLVTGERMMIAHVYLKKGDDVPRHSHENEQLTYILQGALQFWFGPNDERELTVRADSGAQAPLEFGVTVRIDTPKEQRYFQHGGILQYVLRDLLSR